MATIGGFYYGFWEADPKRWSRCRSMAEARMLADGWNRHARKFDGVMMRRARQLWAAGAKNGN